MEINKKTIKKLREKQAFFLYELNGKQKRITAKDVMIRPIFLELEDTVETILEKLQSEEINYCVVVDEDKKFIWEITDEMLLKMIAKTSVKEPLVKFLDIWYKRGINYTHTKDFVKKHKKTIKKETPLFEIMNLINKKWYQFIPVTNEEKKVIWLITPSSILKFVLKK